MHMKFQLNLIGKICIKLPMWPTAIVTCTKQEFQTLFRPARTSGQ